MILDGGVRAGHGGYAAAPQTHRTPAPNPPTTHPPPIVESPLLDRRRWAMLIQRIYQADPLRCPKCGATMKVIAFIESRQEDVIRKILQHCGLWHDPPPRAPPTPPPQARPLGVVPQRDPGFVVEADPEFLEHARGERFEQPDLPWEP